MDVIIDASSIINLNNGNALDRVIQLGRCRLFVTPLVLGECEPGCAASVGLLNNNGFIHFVRDAEISAEMFLEFLEAFNLGHGETECLTLCSKEPYAFCCDDRLARNTAIELFGRKRVIGSLRLLQWCVQERVLTSDCAFRIYENMKSAGGFLPNVERNWFGQ